MVNGLTSFYKETRFLFLKNNNNAKRSPIVSSRNEISYQKETRQPRRR
jgi:hypothetical protein